MRANYLYDADSITAYSKVQDVLIVAAREQVIHEARNARRRPRIAKVGHRLVRLGQWLQTMAHHPIYQEETV